MTDIDERHRKLIQDAHAMGATVEDFARAWASIDGRRDEFDAGRLSDDITAHGGYYDGYVCETEEAFERATRYARERNAAKLE